MKFQFVNWFPRWMGFGWKKTGWAYSLIYDWYFWFLWFEIRKWHEAAAHEGKDDKNEN